jgi:hypothetical protein
MTYFTAIFLLFSVTGKCYEQNHNLSSAQILIESEGFLRVKIANARTLVVLVLSGIRGLTCAAITMSAVAASWGTGINIVQI